MARSAGTMTNIVGIVNESELSIIEQKTLDNLMNNSIGVARSATPSNPQVMAAGGTAVFRIVKLQQFDEYTAANRESAADTPKSEVAVQISIDRSLSTKYELEDLSLPGLAFGSRESFLNHLTAGVSKSLAALLDAEYIEIFVNDIKTIGTNANKRFVPAATKGSPTANEILAEKRTSQIVISDIADLNTDLKAKAAYRKINRELTRLSEQLTLYDLGTNIGDFNTLLHRNVQTDLLLIMPKGGDSATTIGRELANATDGNERIAGLGVVKNHLYFGKNISVGQSFSEEKGYDFSKVHGVIAHKESALLAVQALTIKVARSHKSGNDHYITKFSLFKGMVRPKLYSVIASSEIK